MATNEILPFAGTDTGTNLLTQAEYLADSQRPIGNQPGVARSKLVNKALRQSSLVAAALSQVAADNQAENVVDTLTVSQLAEILETALSNISKGDAGQVLLTRVGTGTFKAFRPDGTEIDISGSTSDGLQEAINEACTGGWNLYVRGGGVAGTAYPGTDVATISCSNTITFPPMQLKSVIFDAVTLNFNMPGSSNPGLLMDSCMMVDFRFEGQVVYNGNGAAVKFAPTNPVPLDNITTIIDSAFRIKTIAYIGGGSDSNSTCVRFTGAQTIGCAFDLGEINGANFLSVYAKYGIFADNSKLFNNVFDIARIHHVSQAGAQIGTNASDTTTRNVWNIGNVEPDGAGSRAIDTFESGGYYNFAATNGAGTIAEGIKLQPNTANNIVVCRNASGVTTPINNLATSGTNVITYNGTVSNASGVANVQLQFGGANVALTTSISEIHYTRVGRIVNFVGVVRLTAKGSSTGTAAITGLPFAAKADVADLAFPCVLSGNNMAAAAITALSASVSAGATSVALQKYAAGVVSNLTDTDFTNTSVVRVSGSYLVA